MYIKEVHIQIEQGLQNIGVFAYSDMLPEELDLAINAKLYSLMDEQIQPLRDAKTKQDKFKLQYILDRFQNLQVKELELAPSLSDNNYNVDLPDNYLHLIADLSRVLSECSQANVTTGNIVSGKWYKVKGQKSIIYNSVTYNTEDSFIGLPSITGYTYSGIGTLKLILLQNNKRANRLTEEELLYQVLDNNLERTDVESPISSLSGNKLYVYFLDFIINKIYLTYLRKPNPVNSLFTTYVSSDTLVIGTKYESIQDSIVYNTVTYQSFVPFIIISGHLSFTGSSKVRIYNDGDLELTNSMSYVLINKVVEDLSIKTEQSQQKIVNLAQENV